ncbi:MAG: hypothetical protein HY907_10405 [Deltaproteobacteria bacterium]|nr:hypothetical protein [Deltaproteobacteria bacterium]
MTKLGRYEVLERAARLAALADEEAASPDPALVQNAAGKGWIAARMAAAPVAECKTGHRPRGTERLRRVIEDLAERSPDMLPLDAHLSRAFADLHLRCSEGGECSPSQIRRMVRAIGEKLVPAAGAACGWAPPAASLGGVRRGARRRS